MSEFMTTLPQSAKELVVVRVSNGWAIYSGEGVFSVMRAQTNLPMCVARTARELSGYLQGWAEQQEAK